MSEREWKHPDAEAAQQDEGDDVEAHRLTPEGEEDKAAATEEPPDVEGHIQHPSVEP